MELKIRCSGELIKFSKLKIYNSKLKKHSLLEIERLIDSIEKYGFLFPINVAELNNECYIVDGEARYSALCELSMRGYDIDKVPVMIIECNDEVELKRLILMATSTNHCLTKYDLEKFVIGTDINLKDFGFNEGTLFDFYNVNDFELEYEYPKGKNKKENKDSHSLFIGEV